MAAVYNFRRSWQNVLCKACASTAMCFLMHNCGTAVLARYSEGEQRERVLKPIANGEKMATLAFSETANGAHFYQPSIQAVRKGDSFILNGKKSFVTNGNQADYYLVVAKAPEGQEGLNIFIVEEDTENLSFSGEWDGIGMAGNSSIVMELNDSPVPARNLVGKEGIGLGVIFDLVAPVFIAGISAVNVGIARAALTSAIEHTKNRTHQNADSSIANYQAIQMYLADMYVAVDAANAHVKKTASMLDNAHCNFTCLPTFDVQLAERFTKILLDMDPNQPDVKQMMELEGLNRWVLSGNEGYHDIANAMKFLKIIEKDPQLV